MSFVRGAQLLRSSARLRAQPVFSKPQARSYAQGPAPSGKSGSAAFILMTGGVVGLATYLYIYGPLAFQQQEKKQEKSPLDPQNFKSFTLKKIVPYNHNTSEFVFNLEDNEASLLPVASCVVVKATDPEALQDKNGKPIIRPYTPISDSNKKGELTFLIKKYDNGNASKHIHNLKVGETLDIKGPITKYPWKFDELETATLIGGGSGITPLYQILSYALPSPENKTKFTLVYSNLTPSDILLRTELDGLAQKYPDNLKLVYVVDKTKKEDKWEGATGYITKDLLNKLGVDSKGGDVKNKVFVCGPPPQMESISGKKEGMKQGKLGGLLKDMGFSEEQVFKF